MYFPLCYFLPGLSNYLCFHVNFHFCRFLLCPRCYTFSVKCHILLFLPCLHPACCVLYHPSPLPSAFCYMYSMLSPFLFGIKENRMLSKRLSWTVALLMSVSCQGHRWPSVSFKQLERWWHWPMLDFSVPSVESELSSEEEHAAGL